MTHPRCRPSASQPPVASARFFTTIFCHDNNYCLLEIEQCAGTEYIATGSAGFISFGKSVEACRHEFNSIGEGKSWVTNAAHTWSVNVHGAVRSACEIIVKNIWFTHLTSLNKLQCGHAASFFASSCGALLFSSRLEMLEVSSCAAAQTAIWRTRMHAAIIQFFAGAIRMRFLFFLIVRTFVLARFTFEIAAEMGMNWMLIGNYLAHVITRTTQQFFPKLLVTFAENFFRIVTQWNFVLKLFRDANLRLETGFVKIFTQCSSRNVEVMASLEFVF